MKPVATITTTKQKTTKIEFHKARLYQFLKEELGFIYVEIDGIGHFLQKNIEGEFKKVYFRDIRNGFLNYIENNINRIPLNGECSIDNLFDAFYEKFPIKENSLIKESLSFDRQLDAHNLHLIRLKTDFEYKKKHTNKLMLKFLLEEGFTETIDKVGDFEINMPIFYKRISQNSFLVVCTRCIDDNNNDISYDLLKVDAKTESEFLKKEIAEEKIKAICVVFDFEKYQKLIRQYLNNEGEGA